MARISELKKSIELLVARGNLAHGYLFFGESLAASCDFTDSLANYLESKRWGSMGTIPLFDAFFLDAEREGGIEAVRLLSQFVSKKPVASPRRTVVIHGAGNLTPAAQHALLKIAEEPPHEGLILLAALHPDEIIPTLASRFQRIHVTPERTVVAGEDPNIAPFVDRILKPKTARERSEALKEFLDAELDVAALVHALMLELRRDLFRNSRVLRDLSRRWGAMNQFNTNRRLQLEAAFAAWSQ